MDDHPFLDPPSMRSTDSLPVRTTAPDLLDLELVQKHIAGARQRGRYTGSGDVQEYLFQSKCLVEVGTTVYATLTGLLTYGLLRPDRHGHFDEDDLAVARAAGQLASHGIEPRHLRPFRTAADRELALVEQVRGPAARRRDDDPAVDILRSCLSLHAALVRGGLGD